MGTSIVGSIGILDDVPFGKDSSVEVPFLVAYVIVHVAIVPLAVPMDGNIGEAMEASNRHT